MMDKTRISFSRAELKLVMEELFKPLERDLLGREKPVYPSKRLADIERIVNRIADAYWNPRKKKPRVKK